jgi:hypothetical protein
MRRLLSAVAGLGLIALMGPALAEPAKSAKADEGTVCHHGTSVDFVDTPSEAAQLAKKEGKLVFVLHISGYFEDPRFT